MKNMLLLMYEKIKRGIVSQFTVKKMIGHVADLVLCILLLLSVAGKYFIGFNLSARIVIVYFCLYMIGPMYRFFLRCSDNFAEGKEKIVQTKNKADMYVAKKKNDCK